MRFNRILFCIRRNIEPIIINKNIKNECFQCKHYIITEDQCRKFGTKDFVKGLIYYDDARNCRHDETKCGIQGNHHEELSTFQYYKKSILTFAYLLRFPLSVIGGFTCLIYKDYRDDIDVRKKVLSKD